MLWTPKVLIAFYSRNCPTESLANAIAEGARGEGAEVRLRRAREAISAELIRNAPDWLERADVMSSRYEAPTQADAEWADAIIFGTPTRFGSISPELKAYVDGLGGLWFRNRIDGKVGSAFGFTSDEHGVKRQPMLTMYTPLAHLGLIIVRLGYGDTAVFSTATPHAAMSTPGSAAMQSDPGHLAMARSQGQRIATVARAIWRARHGCGRDVRMA
jgi:NAD(P)H dehydrogenase (quinone)